MIFKYALLLCILGCVIALMRCTPAERQDAARVAVHAAAVDLIEYCKPTDTVADCIDKLIELGIREIKLMPELKDGGSGE
jgi:hypothetical protein